MMILPPTFGIKEVAPPDILKAIACSCSSHEACSGGMCTGSHGSMSCTTYCNCGANEDKCHNHHTVYEPLCDDHESDTSSDSSDDSDIDI